MTTGQAPKVFLSYTHFDKRVARRLARRLSAHGIDVWIDDNELRPGAELTASIRAQIKDAETLLVVASEESAKKEWVKKEIEFAREHGKTILPFLIEPVSGHERFKDYVGIDATSEQAFAESERSLMGHLYQSVAQELPPADPAKLFEGLRELAEEEPAVAPLILGCLDSEGLHQDNMETVAEASFHALDEALNALFDLRPDVTIAYHAAYGFRTRGAGVRALSLWIGATGDGGTALVSAVGNTVLEPRLMDSAMDLFAACKAPNNQALYNFIDHNASQLNPAQRRSVIRLCTWPVRADAKRLGDVLGWVAFKHFPDAIEIQRMWTRWIESGAFDADPSTLARYLARASKEGLAGWEPIGDALRSHVREYLRSRDKDKVMVATDHVEAAADSNGTHLSLLLGEANGVSGTAEWDDWRKSDPETAEWMGWYVHEVTDEAQGDRNWLRAWDRAKEMVEFEKTRRRILDEEEQGS